MIQAEKVETKVVILLIPDELTKSYSVLDSLHIHKSAKGINYTISGLSRSELRRHYAGLPDAVKDILVQFGKEAVGEVRAEIEKRFSKQRAGLAPEVFLHNALVRHLHQLFDQLKPFFSLIRWYQKAKQPNTRLFKTSPCTFSPFKPQLIFNVVKEGEQLLLQTQVTLNNYTFDLTSFNRYQFLLESRSEYFLLSYKDYQTLEWLEETNMEQYSYDGAAFSQHILARLDGYYTINRNNLFDEKVVETLPVSRVVLSELSNSFLMLTPQWLYDGLIVEGPWKETYEKVLEGEKIIVARHKETESAFLNFLVSLHPNFANQHNGYYYLSFADAQKKQWFLKAYHKLLDLNIEVVGMDLLKHFRYSQFKAETTFSVLKEVGNKVVLFMKVVFGKEEVPLTVLQKTLYAGQRAVLLKDGSLGMLHDEWMQQYSAILKHGKINKNEVEVARFMAISEQQSPGSDTVLQPILKEGWWQKWRKWQQGADPVFTLPATVKAVLRPYQQKGFEWLALLAEAGAGGCLADDMGLGKTLQTICFLAWYIEQFPKTTHIIVCPSSLIYNWQQELKKFAPSINVVVYHGASRNTEDVQRESTQVIITTYGTLRADSESLLTKEYGVAILDESHNIKNPSAQITRTAQLIEASIRVALSGTPVVNNTFDLYAQLSFALPGMFGSREFFKREYADAIDRYHDEEKIKTLQKLTAPFILRRTKEQVAKDLPDKTESILWCKMSTQQEELYNEVKDSIRSNLFTDIKANGLNKSKLAVLQGLLKLRQICNSPFLLPGNEQNNCKDSIKTEVLMDELGNLLPDHKVLVFSQFSTMLQLLAKECTKKGIPYFLLDGQTPPEKRMQMVNEFQEKRNAPHLFLMSLKAGNTGLTLTAADYVFLFDPWWNTAVEQQAIDRTYRIGQTKNVFAYKMICKDTIEEKIVELQQRKKHLADELIAEEDGFVKALSEDDIAYLFS